jgi:hypothetical protein
MAFKKTHCSLLGWSPCQELCHTSPFVLYIMSATQENRASCTKLLAPGPTKTDQCPSKAASLSPPFAVSTAGTTSDDEYVRMLPTFYHDNRHHPVRTTDDLQEFFRHEFDLKRLNDIHVHLWLAGRLMVARPLQRQNMMSRQIIATDLVDLHLTWTGSNIYLKPFPSYLLDRKVWETHLCESNDLYQDALGFVISYVWLICSEIDFQIAMDNSNKVRLLPVDLTWLQWSAFAREVSRDIPIGRITSEHPINKRYHYGELRLNRINLIYRLSPQFRFRHVIRGYHFNYQRYSGILERNFAWLLVVFAYIVIVLTAMQVGLATDELKDDKRFNEASFGFAILSIILPVAAVGIMLLMLGIFFFYNLIAQIIHLRGKRARNWGQNPLQA